MANEGTEDFNQAVAVFDAALKRTRASQLQWSERSMRTGAFEVDLGSGNLEIGYADDDGAPPHDFKIFTPAPDYYHVYTINGRTTPALEQRLAELHSIVERQVVGSERVFNALLQELGDD